jgi:hypothetical protein
LEATKLGTSSELENFTTLQMWGDHKCRNSMGIQENDPNMQRK